MKVCGIDPGLTGYTAVLDEDGNFLAHIPHPVNVVKTSTRSRKTGKVKTKTKTTLDIPKFIEQLKPYAPAVVLIEKQHPVTGQGLASTGKTMFGYGAMCGAVYAMGMQVHLTSAVEWQKVVSDPKAEDKKAASVASVKAWNKEIDLRKTKRSKKDDHNLADAICIARYAYLKFVKTQGE